MRVSAASVVTRGAISWKSPIVASATILLARNIASIAPHYAAQAILKQRLAKVFQSSLKHTPKTLRSCCCLADRPDTRAASRASAKQAQQRQTTRLNRPLHESPTSKDVDRQMSRTRQCPTRALAWLAGLQRVICSNFDNPTTTSCSPQANTFHCPFAKICFDEPSHWSGGLEVIAPSLDDLLARYVNRPVGKAVALFYTDFFGSPPDKRHHEHNAARNRLFSTIEWHERIDVDETEAAMLFADGAVDRYARRHDEASFQKAAAP